MASRLLALVVLLALPSVAGAAVIVHGPQSVLAEHTETRGGVLYFRSPEGDVWELVTRIDDPAIANPGQGAFFPMDPSLVESALEAVAYPLDAVDVEVFILPYPRREILPSSAGHRAVYLSPGVAPLGAQRVCAVVTHELGHVVQHQLMPDADQERWDAYRRLRGIADGAVYHEGAAHRDRPHEIFAEDFRFLFGGDLANYSGGIENPSLALPSSVNGLPEFLLALPTSAGVSRVLPVGQLLVSPNPSRGPVQLSFAGEVSSEVPLCVQVFDVSGRRVAHDLAPASSEVTWDAPGLPAGLYLVRASQGARTWAGKLLVAR